MLTVLVIGCLFLIGCLYIKVQTLTDRVNLAELHSARSMDRAQSAVTMGHSIDRTNHKVEELIAQVQELNPGWYPKVRNIKHDRADLPIAVGTQCTQCNGANFILIDRKHVPCPKCNSNAY